MTHTLLKIISLSLAMFSVVVVPVIFSTDADAKGSKRRLTQDTQLDAPLHGFSGRVGDYYCSYIRIPNRICTLSSNGNRTCKVKGWTLRQTCY